MAEGSVKVLVLGDSGTGKTSIVRTICVGAQKGDSVAHASVKRTVGCEPQVKVSPPAIMFAIARA